MAFAFFEKNLASGAVANENDRSRTFATAVYAEDTISYGKLSVKPGVRYEWLNQTYSDFVNRGRGLSGNSDFYTAGVGTNYQLNDQQSLFGGVYRGISLAGVRASIQPNNPVKMEQSLGYELGFRHQQNAFRSEIAAFYTDFDKLISTDTGVGGNTNQNAGAAKVMGLEGMIQYDAAKAASLNFGLPIYVSGTLTQAEFRGTTAALAGGGDGIYAGGKDGDKLPYIPQLSLAAGIGYNAKKWGANLDVTYAAATWGTGYNGDARPSDVAPTSRDGRIPALTLLNVSAYYQVSENIRLLAGVNNLGDQQKIVSRAPEGPRTNAPRMLYTGFEATF